MARQLKYSTSDCKLGHLISKQKEQDFSVQRIIVNLFFFRSPQKLKTTMDNIEIIKQNSSCIKKILEGIITVSL